MYAEDDQDSHDSTPFSPSEGHRERRENEIEPSDEDDVDDVDDVDNGRVDILLTGIADYLHACDSATDAAGSSTAKAAFCFR